ncbi:hypothetical protein IFM89_019422 [Coptis chinensis]|uniref:Cathepsin propeptide inhibitor domain-containing protein n=1 Tax=Coptis chinensis TaxID=261450 RepID=A0A835IPD1_9MAGN|nr:hypothetical protein IFM89_019422 [Coptis chinensis]
MNCPRIQPTLLFFFFASITSLCLCLSSDQFSILNQDPDDYLSDDRVVELFQQWRVKHEKVYKHEEEVQKRFESFRTNLRFVVERSLKARSSSSKTSHVVGLNKFADLSNEEFKQAYLSKMKKPFNKNKVNELREKATNKVSTCEVPSTFDWRKKGVVTPVKDQGQCGEYRSHYLFFRYQ